MLVNFFFWQIVCLVVQKKTLIKKKNNHNKQKNIFYTFTWARLRGAVFSTHVFPGILFCFQQKQKHLLSLIKLRNSR